jgi:hypothetical protein
VPVASAAEPIEGTPQTASLFRPGWPLTALYAGFPLWWLLGLANFVIPLLAVPMAVRLMRERPLRLPRGFALWALFLVWVLAGVFVLQVDAPGSVHGAGGPGRYLTYAYRVAMYLAATVALLYVGNLSEREVGSTRIARLLGGMFVVTTVGGLVGVLFPHVSLASPVELLLPHALATDPYVQSLVHLRTAEVQTILGYAEARPVAPFNYANAWGANYSFFLPFFLLTWFGRKAGWRRWAGPVVLAVSAVPVAYSLNRGLWGALALGLAYVAVRLALAGRLLILQGLVGGVLVVALMLVVTPLGSLVSSRLDHPHSNDRRSALLTRTVSSVAEGSPVLGFGTTRNVQGSFASIAGGPTARCRGCGVPPLGTQGMLWSVLFYQGLVGGSLYLLFCAVRFLRHWRDRSPYSLAACAIVVMAAAEMFVYDFTGAPHVTLMIALGLAWRSEQASVQPAGVAA